MTTSMNTNRTQVSATGRSSPAQSPGHTARTRIPLDQPPSLHLLRADRRRQVVRRLRQYYAAVRLPATVHHRRTSLDFTMRPRHVGLGSRRISRFSRRLLPCMLGVSDLAGYQRSSPRRNIGCRLPLSPTGSAPRTKSISRLNTQPALSPVNASPPLLRAPPHDSGSSRLARPLTFETFIQYNLPVYPGAQETDHEHCVVDHSGAAGAPLSVRRWNEAGPADRRNDKADGDAGSVPEIPRRSRSVGWARS